ncbi:MAG: hypothetical protein R3C05_23935 [Pirellulaceae bacterium]
MKVLFATDGSCYAAGAARALKHLNSRDPMDLTVLTVSYTPANTSSASVQPWLPEWREREHERIETHHQELGKLLDSVKGTADGASRREPDAKILDRAEGDQRRSDRVGRGHSTIGRFSEAVSPIPSPRMRSVRFWSFAPPKVKR